MHDVFVLRLILRYRGGGRTARPAGAAKRSQDLGRVVFSVALTTHSARDRGDTSNRQNIPPYISLVRSYSVILSEARSQNRGSPITHDLGRLQRSCFCGRSPGVRTANIQALKMLQIARMAASLSRPMSRGGLVMPCYISFERLIFLADVPSRGSCFSSRSTYGAS